MFAIYNNTVLFHLMWIAKSQDLPGFGAEHYIGVCCTLFELCLFFPYVRVSETDSQGYDPGSPHLPWDHPFYDIARHQIIEVAG